MYLIFFLEYSQGGKFTSEQKANIIKKTVKKYVLLVLQLLKNHYPKARSQMPILPLIGHRGDAKPKQ